MANLYDQVISNLKGIIGSNKYGTSLISLDGEYKSFMGTKMPLTELGYSSVESFLRSVPDKFSLRMSEYGLRVFNKIDKNDSESNVALYDMIQNTNSKKKKPIKRLEFRRPLYHERSSALSSRPHHSYSHSHHTHNPHSNSFSRSYNNYQNGFPKPSSYIPSTDYNPFKVDNRPKNNINGYSYKINNANGNSYKTDFGFQSSNNMPWIHDKHVPNDDYEFEQELEEFEKYAENDAPIDPRIEKQSANINQNNIEISSDDSDVEHINDSDSSDDENKNGKYVQTDPITYPKFPKSQFEFTSPELIATIVPLLLQYKDFSFKDQKYEISREVAYYFRKFTGLAMDVYLFRDIVLAAIDNSDSSLMYRSLLRSDDKKHVWLNLVPCIHTKYSLPDLDFNPNGHFSAELLKWPQNDAYNHTLIRLTEYDSDNMRIRENHTKDFVKDLIEGQIFWSWIPSTYCLVKFSKDIVGKYNLGVIERAVIINWEIAAANEMQALRQNYCLLHKVSFYLPDQGCSIPYVLCTGCTYYDIKNDENPNNSEVSLVSNLPVSKKNNPARALYFEIENIKQIKDLINAAQVSRNQKINLILSNIAKTNNKRRFSFIYKCTAKIDGKKGNRSDRPVNSYNDIILEPSKTPIKSQLSLNNDKNAVQRAKVNTIVSYSSSDEDNKNEIISLSSSDENDGAVELTKISPAKMQNKTSDKNVQINDKGEKGLFKYTFVEESESISSKCGMEPPKTLIQDDNISFKNSFNNTNNKNNSQKSQVESQTEPNHPPIHIGGKNSQTNTRDALNQMEINEHQNRVSSSLENSHISSSIENQTFTSHSLKLSSLNKPHKITIKPSVIDRASKLHNDSVNKCLIPLTDNLSGEFKGETVALLNIKNGIGIISKSNTMVSLKRKLIMQKLCSDNLVKAKQVISNQYYLKLKNSNVNGSKGSIELIQALNMIDYNTIQTLYVHSGLISIVPVSELYDIPDDYLSSDEFMENIIGSQTGSFVLHMIPEWFELDSNSRFLHKHYIANIINNELVLEFYDEPCRYLNIELLNEVERCLSLNHCNVKSKSFLIKLAENLFQSRITLGFLIAEMEQNGNTKNDLFTNAITTVKSTDQPDIWFASIDFNEKDSEIYRKLSPSDYTENKFCMDRVYFDKSKRKIVMLDHQDIYIDPPEQFEGIYKFDEKSVTGVLRGQSEYYTRYMLSCAAKIPDLSFLYGKLVF